MRFPLVLAGLVLLCDTAVAAHGPDLMTSIAAPSGTLVYGTDTYWVTVDNNGNRHANNVSLTIDLPETNTSPTVHVMGIVGAMSNQCVLNGLQIDCNLGRIRRGRSVTVTFDIALAESTDALTVTATASTAGEVGPADNVDSVVADLANYSHVISTPSFNIVDHCTGTGLTSFYECVVTPTSISSHTQTLNGDFSITVVPGVQGTWWSNNPEHLAFEYRDDFGNLLLEFEGYGTSLDCWEGKATFPNSSYVSMYSVCY